MLKTVVMINLFVETKIHFSGYFESLKQQHLFEILFIFITKKNILIVYKSFICNMFLQKLNTVMIADVSVTHLDSVAQEGGGTYSNSFLGWDFTTIYVFQCKFLFLL